MEQFYDSDNYFLVGDVKTRNIYVVHTIYKMLFISNRPEDEFPCYLYLGKGVIKKESRHFILRKHLDYAKEIVAKPKPVKVKQMGFMDQKLINSNLFLSSL